LHWRLPNSARNLAEAEFGRIWEKWPNFEFAEAKAEIRCNPSRHVISKSEDGSVDCNIWLQRKCTGLSHIQFSKFNSANVLFNHRIVSVVARTELMTSWLKNDPSLSTVSRKLLETMPMLLPMQYLCSWCGWRSCHGRLEQWLEHHNRCANGRRCEVDAVCSQTARPYKLYCPW